MFILPRLIRIVAALLLAPLLALPAPASARTPTDWTHHVTALPDGAFLVGNPNAKTQLVEYFSYTCPHCAEFAKQADAPLRAGWIKSGQLSLEYRNYVRDGYDLTAALLAHCGGAATFLNSHDAIFANYDTWIAQAATYSKAQQDKPPPTDRGAQFVGIADNVGLTALVAKQGLSPAALHQCLTDKELVAKILALTAGAWDADPGFTGTPTFILDGKPVNTVHGWADLKPLLPAPAKPLPAPAS